MDTDQVEQLASRIEYCSQVIQESSDQVLRQAETTNWQGGSREALIMQIEDCCQRLRQYGHQMQELQMAQRAETAQWVDAAAKFGNGTQGQASIVSDALQGFWGSIISPFRDWYINKIWEDASLEERIRMANAYLSFIVSSYGLQVPLRVIDIKDLDGHDSRGYYRPDSRDIQIDIDNMRDDDPRSLLGTIAHEARHSVQHYLIEHPEDRPQEISEEQIKSWKENFDNYIEAENDFEGYQKQTVEVDARDFAAMRINDFLEKGIGFKEVKSAVKGVEK